MDTSKEYIKQCEKAEEIQNHAQVDEHSYVVSSISGNEISQDDDAFVFEIVKQGGRVIWLPRQDQLQILSGLSWQEFDKECLKYNTETKEQAGIQVVRKRLAKTTQ